MGMEKGGENVQLGPIFPRLNVNDHYEQGGRRAPPRNKMAICARVNAPSQRVPSGSIIPSTSLGHGHSQKMNGLPLFCSSSSKQLEFPNWRSGSGSYKALNAMLPLSFLNPHHNYYHSANSPAKLYPSEKALNGSIRIHRVEKERGIFSDFEREYSRNQPHFIKEDRRDVVVPLNIIKHRLGSARMHQERARTEIISGDLQRLSQKTSYLKSLHLEEAEVSVISDSSEVNSASRPDTTPDDVVRVIGLNSFWKIRRTIEHQQKILAAQVFELHRLVKVQRLIARSPELLRGGNVASSKPSIFSENKLKRKVLPDDKKLDIGDINPNVILKPFSSTPPSRAPGYQWLVPVRSRTEGLVYKPYKGRYPPAPGFIAPVHGASYGLPLPASDQPGIVTSYTGPYGNAHSSEASISKQDSGTDLSIIPYQKIQKPHTLNQGRGTTTDGLPLFPTKPMDQDQSAPHSITPYQKPRNINPTIDALPLFPTKPVDRDQIKQQKIEVIKVVPHNPKSTSESAARIFRSIQEERKQHT